MSKQLQNTGQRNPSRASSGESSPGQPTRTDDSMLPFATPVPEGAAGGSGLLGGSSDRRLILIVLAVCLSVLLLVVATMSVVAGRRAVVREAELQALKTDIHARIERCLALAEQDNYTEALSDLKAVQAELGHAAPTPEELLDTVRQHITQVTEAHHEYEESRVESMIGSVIGRADAAVERYEFAEALDHIQKGEEEVAATFVRKRKHTARLADARKRVRAAEQRYNERVAAGWVMYDGRFVTPEERDAVLAQRADQIDKDALVVADAFDFGRAVKIIDEFEQGALADLPANHPTRVQIIDLRTRLLDCQVAYKNKLASGYVVWDGKLVHADFRDIQGVWQQIDKDKVWQYKFVGGTIIIATGYRAFHGGIEIERGDFSLNPHKIPKWVTWGGTYGIYELDGDYLTICYVMSGEKSERPKTFDEPHEDSWDYLWRFKRKR